MRLSENRVLAWIVLAACVLGSVFGLGGASLAREHVSATEAFTKAQMIETQGTV